MLRKTLKQKSRKQKTQQNKKKRPVSGRQTEQQKSPGYPGDFLVNA